MSETQVDAIVLAGGERSDREPGRGAPGDERYEALIEIGGRPMVEYVIAALRRSRRVGRIVVVGPARTLRERLPLLDFEPVEAGETMVENLLRGIERLGTEHHVLVATCDIPLVTTEAIEDFIDRCRQVEADIYYPIVSKDANERLYPGVQRTYVRLRDGTFTGGNVVLLEPAVVVEAQKLIERAVRARKKPWQLSKLLGFRFIVKLLTKKLTLSEIEDRVGRMLGLRGAVIVSPYPEIGLDVDKATDLELVTEAISRRGTVSP